MARRAHLCIRHVHFPSSITPLHAPGLAGPVVSVHGELGGLVGVCAGALSPRAGRVLHPLDLTRRFAWRGRLVTLRAGMRSAGPPGLTLVAKSEYSCPLWNCHFRLSRLGVAVCLYLRTGWGPGTLFWIQGVLPRSLGKPCARNKAALDSVLGRHHGPWARLSRLRILDPWMPRFVPWPGAVEAAPRRPLSCYRAP